MPKPIGCAGSNYARRSRSQGREHHRRCAVSESNTIVHSEPSGGAKLCASSEACAQTRRIVSLAASLCFLSQAPQGALAAAHVVGRETGVARTGAGHGPSSVLPAAAPFSGVESISRSDVNPTEPVGLSILSMSKLSAAETSAASMTLESTRCRAVAAATRSPLALASALRTESVEPRDSAVAPKGLRLKRTRTSSCWHPAQDSRYDTPENGMMQCTASDSTDSETRAALQIKRRTRSSTSSG